MPGLRVARGHPALPERYPQFLRRAIQAVRRITELSLLVRLDGGNYTLESYTLESYALENDTLSQEAGVDFLVKHNWRREDPTVWEEKARILPESAWSTPREGKRVARLSERCERIWKDGEREVVVRFRRVVEVTERTIDRKGNVLLMPITEVDAWITSLEQDEVTVIGLYKDHGTSEQFPSEMRSWTWSGSPAGSSPRTP